MLVTSRKEVLTTCGVMQAIKQAIKQVTYIAYVPHKSLAPLFNSSPAINALSRQNRPPKNRSSWTDFGKKNLLKVVPPTTFAAKIGPAGQILAAKIGPPCQFWSPTVYYFLCYTIELFH